MQQLTMHLQSFPAVLHAALSSQNQAAVLVFLALLHLSSITAASSNGLEEGLQIVTVKVCAAEDKALVSPA